MKVFFHECACGWRFFCVGDEVSPCPKCGTSCRADRCALINVFAEENPPESEDVHAMCINLAPWDTLKSVDKVDPDFDRARWTW